jgi:hypothetical protein
MRKAFVLLLASLIVVLTVSLLMFTSVVSAEDSVEINGKIYCLVKGDLLFYDKEIFSKSPGHVGIYSGNGKVIDAYPRGPDDPGDSGVDEWGFEEEGNYFDTDKFLGVRRVKTSQGKRDSAVDWALTKIGADFEYLPEDGSGAPNEPGSDKKWYCSELVHCAYKSQGITLGSKITWPLPYHGYIPPIYPLCGIWNDDDVESTSQECPAGSPNAGAYYAPGTTEDGCCEWSGQCFDGNQPSKCSACYGGTWHSGWQCEGGECVPEASTLVLFATGLLFLAGYLGFRRKEN